MGKKIFSQGLIGKLFGFGKSDDAAEKARAEARQTQQVSNDRQQSNLQADAAKKAGSRKRAKGRNLFVDAPSRFG